MNKLGKLPILAMCLYFVVCAACPAVAPAQTSKSNAKADEIAKTLDIMGYTITDRSGNSVYFNVGNYKVSAVMSDDNSIIYIIIAFSMKPQDLDKLPGRKYLNFNTTNRAYTFVQFDDKGKPISEGVQDQLTASALSAKTLRTAIDSLVSSADSLPIDPAKW